VDAALPRDLDAAVGQRAEQVLAAQPSSSRQCLDGDEPGLLDRLVGDGQLRAAAG
jgi:hypothetical protein